MKFPSLREDARLILTALKWDGVLRLPFASPKEASFIGHGEGTIEVPAGLYDSLNFSDKKTKIEPVPAGTAVFRLTVASDDQLKAFQRASLSSLILKERCSQGQIDWIAASGMKIEKLLCPMGLPRSNCTESAITSRPWLKSACGPPK